MRPNWRNVYEEYWRGERKRIRDEFLGLLVGGLAISFLSYLFYGWNWEGLGEITAFIGGLMLLGSGLVLIGLVVAHIRHAAKRPIELRIKDSVYPLLSSTEPFIYFGNKGEPAAIWLHQLNLEQLAKSQVSRHVLPLCSQCGRRLPLGAKRCGPCRGARAVVVFSPDGNQNEVRLITVHTAMHNDGWICAACDTFNEQSTRTCEVCDARRN